MRTGASWNPVFGNGGKFTNVNFTLVNGLPNTNRGFDDNYLVVSGEWFLPGRRCPTKDGVPGPSLINFVFNTDL